MVRSQRRVPTVPGTCAHSLLILCVCLHAWPAPWLVRSASTRTHADGAHPHAVADGAHPHGLRTQRGAQEAGDHDHDHDRGSSDRGMIRSTIFAFSAVGAVLGVLVCFSVWPHPTAPPPAPLCVLCLRTHTHMHTHARTRACTHRSGQSLPCTMRDNAGAFAIAPAGMQVFRTQACACACVANSLRDVKTTAAGGLSPPPVRNMTDGRTKVDCTRTHTTLGAPHACTGAVPQSVRKARSLGSRAARFRGELLGRGPKAAHSQRT